MLKEQSLRGACLQAPVPTPGHGGHPLHSRSMLQPPQLRVPRTKVRAPILPTLTHFSINGFLNTSHTWNKPLTKGPPPDLPSPALLICPPVPVHLSRDAPSAAHRRCRVSKQPGIPGLAPAGRKPSPAELMHPNSGADEATFLAGWRQAAFGRRPGHSHEARAGTCWVLFPGAHPHPSHFMEELLQLQGGSFGPPAWCCPSLTQTPCTQPSHAPSGKRQAYHHRERKLR